MMMGSCMTVTDYAVSRSMMVVTVITVVLMLDRFVVFLYRPGNVSWCPCLPQIKTNLPIAATGKFMPNLLFYFLGYWIPELILR